MNSRRGSLDFDNGGDAEGEAPDTFLDQDSFEPRDAIKGDVARSIFYVDVRYEGTGGEPDLVLVDQLTGKGTTLGDLCTLLEWHIGDPPDATEREVNNAVELIQGNRNAFVDEPNLALALYGSECGRDGSTLSALTLSAPLTPTTSSAPTLAATSDGGDGALRIATWNIENFWHVENEHLRPARDGGPGTQRSADDYDAVLAVIEELGADVIGLQEIGAPEGVRLLFPASEWNMVFSKRLEDDLALNPGQLDDDAERDIYTAVVVRRGVADIVGTERIKLNELGGTRRRLREGTAVLLDVNGTRFWAVSVHLKSGCFEDNRLTSSSSCRTLAQQIPILEDWLDEKSSNGEMVALLGDFNRQLDRGSDVVREDLDDNDPVDIFKIPHRERLECRAFRPGETVSIDYVLLNEDLWDFAIVPDTPKLNFSDSQISDHCPVFVDLKLPD